MTALGQTAFLGAPMKAAQAASHAAPKPCSVVCSLRPHKKLILSVRPPPQLFSRKQHAGRSVRTADAAAAGSVGSGWMDMPESQPLPEQPLEVFPRRHERDPYKLLGVTREADFEEVQEARNFLVEQYKGHEPSREAVELAFEKVLSEHMKRRKTGGFKPPQRGRRGEVAGDAPKLSLWQQVRDKFEPSVPSTTIVNDGSIFLALALWAAWQAASADPTLPLGAAICYCAYKLYDKRSKRMGSTDPDRTPIWGALGATLLALVLGGVLSYMLAAALPLPAGVRGEGVFAALIALSLGFTALFLK